MGGQLFDAIGGGIFLVVERSLQVIICLPREREGLMMIAEGTQRGIKSIVRLFILIYI